MLLSLQSLVVASGILSLTIAAPASSGSKELVRSSSDVGSGLSKRQSGPLIDIISGVVNPILNGITGDITNGAQVVAAILAAADDTIEPQLRAVPTSIPEALERVSDIFASTPIDLLSNILELIPNGFPVDQVVTLLTASIAPENSVNNDNPVEPARSIYPKKIPQDAPYDLTEEEMRQNIYIPSTFTYGQKPPVILVPGTGNTGFQTYAGNYIPLLTGVSYADPVWLNIPGQLLNDAAENSERIAYAINYIAGITGQNVTVISWSQGGLDTQWALKYWPSTRLVTTQHIANSPDYHGTVLAKLLCPDFPRLPCPPSVLQQDYDSTYVATLRADGGDSAFVPTTNIFSATDEIVQPMAPVEAASAFLKDDCNLGVTNAQVQDICGGRGPAGTFYTHEGVLYNPLGYALTVGALQNKAPVDVASLDLDTVCGQVVSPGLDLIDVLTTEEAVLIATVSIVLYFPKVFEEPAIKAYTQSGVVYGCDFTNGSTPPGVGGNHSSSMLPSLSLGHQRSTATSYMLHRATLSTASSATGPRVTDRSTLSPSHVSSVASMVHASTRAAVSSGSSYIDASDHGYYTAASKPMPTPAVSRTPVSSHRPGQADQGPAAASSSHASQETVSSQGNSNHLPSLNKAHNGPSSSAVAGKKACHKRKHA